MRIKILKENKSDDKVHAKATYLQDEEDYEKDQAYAIAYQYKEDGKLEEMSTVAGIQGHASPINKKDDELNELFSSSTQTGGLRISIVSAEKEHAGHVERSQKQNLRNVMEDDDSTQPMMGGADNYAMANQGTVWKLTDFADSSRNASRVFDVLDDAIKNIGLETMKNAVLDDQTAQSRIKVMSDKFGYDSELYMNIAMGNEEAVKKYYQFIINEFLFWSSFNPMASAQQYSGRASLLSKPTKDLAYAQVYRYVKNPSVNNPKSLGQRVSKQASDYFLTKDLDPALYDLPEE